MTKRSDGTSEVERFAVKDESGQLGGLEGLAFGVLIFVMGTLVVVNAWA